MDNLSARELRDEIAAGRISSLDATKTMFERIRKLEPTIGAYISTYEDQAQKTASDVDRRIAAGEPVGLLAGVPVSGRIEGQLKYAAPVVDAATQTFRCVFTINNQDLRLPAGFSVRLDIPSLSPPQ